MLNFPIAFSASPGRRPEDGRSPPHGRPAAGRMFAGACRSPSPAPAQCGDQACTRELALRARPAAGSAYSGFPGARRRWFNPPPYRDAVPFADEEQPHGLRLQEPGIGWAEEGQRLGGELKRLLGTLAVRIDHIGSTSVPGLPAKDCIDLMVRT